MINHSIRINGTGSYLPDRILTNPEVAVLNGAEPDWAERKIGIIERRIAHPDQMTSDLAYQAALKALAVSDFDRHALGLIIVATATPDRKAPSTAAIVHDKLGLDGCVAFDISAVCSVFLYALSVATSLIASRAYEHIMVIGADRFSSITDWSTRDSFFFGDGAGAVIVSNDRDSAGFCEYALANAGKGIDNFTVPTGAAFFSMNGPAVFESAVSLVTQCISELFEKTNFSPSDVSRIVPHQPSIHLLRKIAEVSGLPLSRFELNMSRYANTAGATIPIALDEAVRSTRVSRGDLLLMLAAGAGMTGGAMLIKY